MQRVRALRSSPIPSWVLEAHGPGRGWTKVVLGERTGLNFTRAGDVVAAERCPAREGSVWIWNPDGTAGFRLNAGEWSPAVRRRARSLEAL